MIKKLSCGAELPQDAIDWSSDALRDALFTNRFILIRGVKLTKEQYWNFMSKFGTPWLKNAYVSAHEKEIEEIGPEKFITHYHHNSYASLKNSILAHADVANEPHSPHCPIRSLYCVSLPEAFSGGETFCISLTEAFKKYNPAIKEKYKKHQVLYQSWQRHGTYRNWYELLQHHPYTREPFFFLNHPATHKYPWIIGFRDENKNNVQLEEIDQLIEISKSISYYEHSWKVGDLLIIDNLGSLHGRTQLMIDQERSSMSRTFWRINVNHNLQLTFEVIERIPD